MSSRTTPLTPALESYVLKLGEEPEILREMRRETAALPGANMQIGPDQGRFMRWLVELIGARRCLEIGVYTGYSSTAVALGLGDDARLVACDVDPDVTAIAERYWKRANVAHKIRLELRPAAQTLRGLLDAGEAASYDFAFMDADKESYDHYYELCLELLRRDGLLLLDNTLWGGKVIEPDAADAATRAIVGLNLKISRDERVSACLLPLYDGLTLVRKL